MTDFPPEPAPSWTGIRDRIEAQLVDFAAEPHQQWVSSYNLRSPGDRRTLAGILRKAFAPQLDTARHDAETLDRIRKLVRRHRYDETIPRRELEAALHGDEQRG